MSWNAGAGRPNLFRCAKCRRRGMQHGGRRGDVDLTGRTRERMHSTLRHGTTLREYKCRTCGHVGWSAHVDLADRQ